MAITRNSVVPRLQDGIGNERVMFLMLDDKRSEVIVRQRPYGADLPKARQINAFTTRIVLHYACIGDAGHKINIRDTYTLKESTTKQSKVQGPKECCVWTVAKGIPRLTHTV